jgi:hypothetical protein
MDPKDKKIKKKLESGSEPSRRRSLPLEKMASITSIGSSLGLFSNKKQQNTKLSKQLEDRVTQWEKEVK